MAMAAATAAATATARKSQSGLGAWWARVRGRLRARVRARRPERLEGDRCAHCKGEGYLELYLLGPVPCPVCAPERHAEEREGVEVRSRAVPVLSFATLGR